MSTFTIVPKKRRLPTPTAATELAIYKDPLFPMTDLGADYHNHWSSTLTARYFCMIWPFEPSYPFILNSHLP